MKITKIDNNTIKVIKETTTETDTNFTYNYLVEQKKSITAQKKRDNIQRDVELAEIDEMIAECDKLGVKLKEKILKK